MGCAAATEDDHSVELDDLVSEWQRSDLAGREACLAKSWTEHWLGHRDSCRNRALLLFAILQELSLSVSSDHPPTETPNRH
jgi:hypothetical protein